MSLISADNLPTRAQINNVGNKERNSDMRELGNNWKRACLNVNAYGV